MCLYATVRGITLGILLTSTSALAVAQIESEWRHIGNAAIELALPSTATGPVDRVWYSADGETLYAKTRSGRTFTTSDFESWKAVRDAAVVPPAETELAAPNSPEPGARARTRGARTYSFARNAFRSDNNGDEWVNLTSYKGTSILGSPLSDLAVSPVNPDEISAANAAGVWRSVDAGLTWVGLNSTLPNLPVRRLYGLPSGMRGIRIGLAVDWAPELEWSPGEKRAWHVSDATDAQDETRLKQAASRLLNTTITAIAMSADTVYAGSAEGSVWVSQDRGVTWNQPWTTIEAGRVEAIYADPKDPRTALAAFSGHTKPLSAGVQAIHVMRTMNAGLFWDQTTANLPDVAAHGITADRASNAIYVATDAGVFYTTMDLGSAGRPTAWAQVSNGLPEAPAMDVRLDAGANQLYVAMDGYGVYATVAPHRFREARLVNAADFSGRAAAPGSLLSVIGARVTTARSGDNMIPVLASDANGTQIQVPFEAKGQNLALAFDSPRGQIVAGFPLRDVSPAIFVDPDGTPMILDGDSGSMLDASKPAHSGSRIQILTTGLGRVNPDWPTGTPGPSADPPKVVARVKAYLDQTPIDVGRAVLAPYIGFYLIEVELPRIVNSGPAEIYIEAEGQPSNRVRLYIEP